MVKTDENQRVLIACQCVQGSALGGKLWSTTIQI